VNKEALADSFLAAVSNDIFHLTILPTEQCNFRCTYCYEEFEIGKMTCEVVEAVKRLLQRRIPSLRQLIISWFGGEPLIALDVIQDIGTFAHELAKRIPELKYSGSMTTNGYGLNISTAQRLHAMNITDYQVSLDGPEHIHDQSRIQIGGKGTFKRIWQNLLEIRNSSLPISVLLRVHITGLSLPLMPEFLRQLRDDFLQDSRFRILLKPVGRWGGPYDEQISVIKEADQAGVLDRLMNGALAGLRANAFYKSDTSCYAARPNSLVIRANGDVGKCTVALADPANRIGRLLPDGTLRIDNELLRPWLRGWADGNTNELECPLMGLPRNTEPPVLFQIGVRPAFIASDRFEPTSDLLM
jgi:uncharacterized protein